MHTQEPLARAKRDLSAAHGLLNTAQTLVLSFNEGGNSLKDYKAPHAMRGTPPRQRKFTRHQRFLVSEGDAEAGTPDEVRRPRLFKGHRI